jgi:hypothetical protein
LQFAIQNSPVLRFHQCPLYQISYPLHSLSTQCPYQDRTTNIQLSIPP